MMNDPALNPLTHDWNKVLIPYCDGGSFAGNNDSVTYVEIHGVRALKSCTIRSFTFSATPSADAWAGAFAMTSHPRLQKKKGNQAIVLPRVRNHVPSNQNVLGDTDGPYAATDHAAGMASELVGNVP